MRIQSGKMEGKTTEEVALKHPDWAQWFINNVREGKVTDDLRRLMRQFDEKPFVQKCDGKCDRVATRATAYKGGNLLYFWCDECKPYSSGARSGTLDEVRTLRDLLRHVDAYSAGNRGFKRQMTKTMAEAKGLPKRVGAKQAVEFFSIKVSSPARLK